MKVIHKFLLEIIDEQKIMMPKGAEILDVQVQRGEACVWALVNTNEEPIPHHFTVVGTGQALGAYLSLGKYIATFQAGSFVGHVFHGKDFFEDDDETKES